MRNFKDFLLERLNNNKVTFTIDMGYDEVVADKYFQSIKPKIETLVQGYTGRAMQDDLTIVLKFEDLSEQQAVQGSLEQVIKTVEVIEKRELKVWNLGKTGLEKLKSEGYDTYLSCNGFPPFPMEYQYIYLAMKSGESISGIDKMIGLCETLNIHDCQNITGGLLSLLRLKEALNISLLGNKMPHNWIPIVDKHLKGDKDIIECKEELIAAGFKDLAKL